jgi:hypothetical protein
MIFILAIIYIYINILLLEITIVNLILLGVFFTYTKSFIKFLLKLKEKLDTKHLNKKLHIFIEDENVQFYRTQRNIELVAEYEGQVLELQLPDDVEDIIAKQQEKLKLSEYRSNTSTSKAFSEERKTQTGS